MTRAPGDWPGRCWLSSFRSRPPRNSKARCRSRRPHRRFRETQVEPGGQPLLEPDYGVSWLQPGTRFGIFQLELRGTRRDGLPAPWQNLRRVRDLKYRGLAWSLEAGDTYFSPAVGDYRFANLAAPSLTFVGGGVSARSPRTSVGVIAGRATAWRNLFGTDPDTLDQQIIVGRASHKPTDRLELSTRASRMTYRRPRSSTPRLSR